MLSFLNQPMVLQKKDTLRIFRRHGSLSSHGFFPFREGFQISFPGFHNVGGFGDQTKRGQVNYFLAKDLVSITLPLLIARRSAER